MHKYTERNDITVFAPADSNPIRTSPWLSMAAFREVVVTALSGTITEAGTLKVQIKQAQDANGTGAKALTAETTVTAGAGGEALKATLSAFADSMDEGFTHVAVTLLASDAAGIAGAVITRTKGRYL